MIENLGLGLSDDGERDAKKTSLSHLSVWPREATEDIYTSLVDIPQAVPVGDKDSQPT